jgi:hypothetical protein
MGTCCSKTQDNPEAEEDVQFRLRKTADGRRIESTDNLGAMSLSEDKIGKVGSMESDLFGTVTSKKAKERESKAEKLATSTKAVGKKDYYKAKKDIREQAEVESDSIDEGIEAVDPDLMRARTPTAHVMDTEPIKPTGEKPLAPPTELSANLKRYKDETKLKANETRKLTAPEWVAPPDIKSESAVRQPKEYVLGDHGRGDHVLKEREVFQRADFSTYNPGTGPWLNGPSDAFMRRAAKDYGVFVGSIAYMFVIASSCLPNLIFWQKLDMNGSITGYVRVLLAVFCNTVSLYSLLALKMEFKRFFWRSTLPNITIVCALVSALSFCWQTMAVITIAWLDKNRGIFSFFAAFVGGLYVVFKHERKQYHRHQFDAVLSQFLEIEKNSHRMAELMGMPAVRTNATQFMDAAPVWARYRPDELVDWLNKFLNHVWPFYNRAISDLLREILEPLMEACRPSMLKRLTFKELDFGENPFVIRNITYVGSKSDDMAVSLDIDFAWAGKSNIILAAKTHIGADINIAVKDLEIYTKLRVSLHPLVPLPSPLGGVVISMTERPIIEFDAELPSGLDVLYNVIDKWLEEFVADIIGDMFIQPERLVVPLSFNFDPIVMPDGEVKPFKWYDTNVLQLHNTGVLKVTVVRAENVPRTDLLSKTDPYVKLFIKKHGLEVKTTTKQNDEDPTWEETFYIPVDDVYLRTLKVAVFDSDADPLSSDERLAINEVPIAPLKEATMNGESEEVWVDFPEQVSGNKSKPPMRLLLDTQFIMFGTELAKTRFAGLGLLSVHVIRAINLQVMDSNGLSDPYVKVKIPVDEMGAGLISMNKKDEKRQQKLKQKQKDKSKQEYVEYASKIHYKNLNPEFNERFEFSPASEDAKVTIEIFDVDSTFPVGKKSNFMGNLIVPISTIVEHGGTMEARFKVGNAKSGEIDLAFNWQPYT